MERILYLHIGGPKTGTKTLQNFFYKNRQALRDRGYFYPGRGLNHLDICDELGEHNVSRIRSLPGLSVMRWIEEVEISSCPSCIISAECLAFRGGAKKLRELLSSSCRVKVIYYARRQDELIESRYNQFVKAPVYRMKENLDEDLVDSFYERVDFDHLQVITPWAEIFGKDNVIVRCFEEIQMPNGIIEDFTRIIGLSLDDTLKIPATRMNKSLDIHHTEFIRLCNRAFKDMPEINDYLDMKHFKENRALNHVPVQHRLSPTTRIEILNHYEESNRQFAREYLGREDGRLFYAPWPDPQEPWEPYRGLTAEELVPIFTEMIYTAEMRQVRVIQKKDLQPLTSCLEILNYFLKKVMLLIPGRIKQYFQEKNDRWYNRK
ncbi:MAG: hypothetical protein EHM53_04875 [Methanoregulaceae archaeon]|nr:MAG: hypothetical protein EHM53_04875 [Methanoregulaceae archaeon]